jgi:hypothetical protein
MHLLMDACFLPATADGSFSVAVAFFSAWMMLLMVMDVSAAE